MDVVCTENAHNKSLLYSGREALSKPSTGEELLLSSPLNGTYHKWGKGDSIEIDQNCHTNAKYNI